MWTHVKCSPTCCLQLQPEHEYHGSLGITIHWLATVESWLQLLFTLCWTSSFWGFLSCPLLLYNSFLCRKEFRFDRLSFFAPVSARTLLNRFFNRVAGHESVTARCGQKSCIVTVVVTLFICPWGRCRTLNGLLKDSCTFSEHIVL